MHAYHMDPYWGPLVFAYIFRVRVVVVTRNTIPIEEEQNATEQNATDANATEKMPTAPSTTKATSADGNSKDDKGSTKKTQPKKNTTNANATEKMPTAPSTTKATSADGNSTNDKATNETVIEGKKKKKKTYEYVHTTKIFDFVDGFENDIDNYVPVKSYEKLFRLSDAAFYSKPTIELLYITGFTKKNIPDDNHFLFLRRALCVKVPPKLPISDVSLRDFIIQQSLSNS